DHVGLWKKDHAVAVGMAARKMDGPYVFPVQMHGHLIVKGDDRQRDFGRRLDFAEARLASFRQALAHVFLGDDRGLLTKVRIAAGVVAVPMRVKHELDRLVGYGLE